MFTVWVAVGLVFTVLFICDIFAKRDLSGIPSGSEPYAQVTLKAEGTFSELIHRDGTRTLILLWAGITGLYFLNRRTSALEENARAANENALAATKTARIATENLSIAEQGLVNDRLTRCIDLLNSSEASVSIAGIIGLQQIAESQNEVRKDIVHILSAHIRTKAPKQKALTRDEQSRIQVAVHALAKVTSKMSIEEKEMFCDLRKTNLTGIDLAGQNLSSFQFGGASLCDVHLEGASLIDASLVGCDLYEAIFDVETNLHGAEISLAYFQDAEGLTQEQISSTRCDFGLPTCLPSGLEPPNSTP